MLPGTQDQYFCALRTGYFVRFTGDELSDAAHQIDSSLADIEEEVDDATEEVEDGRDQRVDERGECADDTGKKLIDRLEEVLEGSNEFGHLDCDFVGLLW